jgi:hypothetical protein
MSFNIKPVSKLRPVILTAILLVVGAAAFTSVLTVMVLTGGDDMGALNTFATEKLHVTGTAADAVQIDGSEIINGNTTWGATTATTHQLNGPFTQETISSGNSTIERHSGGPATHFKNSQGTHAAPTASDDVVGQLRFTGYGTTAYQGSYPALQIGAAETWTDTANGSQVSLWTTPNGSKVTAKRTQIENDGTLHQIYNLIVDLESTLTGRAKIRALNLSPASTVGQLAYETIFSNWAPTGLQTTTMLMVTGSDDSGTIITGIDSTNIQVGDVRTICNVNGPNDDSTVALTNLDARSLIANRILTPGAGRIVDAAQIDFYIGPDECTDVVYAQPDFTDSTVKYWVVKGSRQRFSSVVTQQLQFYNGLLGTAITGTINNYAMTPVAPYACSPGAVSCYESANNGNPELSTMLFLQTVDGTGAVLTGLNYTVGKPSAVGPVKILVNVGPGPVTLKNIGAGSTSINQFGFSNTGGTEYDIVMQPNGPPVMLYHVRDSGHWIQIGHNDYVFDAQVVTARNGISLKRGTAAVALDMQNTAAATATQSTYVRVIDSGTYATGGTAFTTTGITVSITATRASGTGALTNIGAQLAATGGQDNYSLITTTGKIYLGQGGGTTLMYVNFPYVNLAHDLKTEGNFVLGNGDFAGATTAHMVTSGTVPVLSSCGTSPTIVGSDVAGRFVTGAGATACTMTFARTYTIAPSCTLQPSGSATLPTCTFSATAITCSLAAPATTYNYICMVPTGGS